MSDDKTAKARHRGQQAKSILENELVVESFQEVERRITEAWKNTKAQDQEEREKAFMMLCALNQVHKYLVEVLNTGKMANHKLFGEQNPLKK